MSNASPRFGLPYILPSQAQKHVTHNEAIEALDTMLHLTVQTRDAETPPAAPQQGQTWALGAAPIGDWAGQAGKIAHWDGLGWLFLDPAAGMRAWDVSVSTLVAYDGTDWRSISGDLQNVDGVGVGTTSDVTNKLAVASDATLLTHAGASHQLKVNKAADTDTASLLFQSNWTGHAEMGLAGDTDFSIKVSGDGSAWTEALRFDAVTGLPTGSAVQQSADDVTPGRLARADYAYGPGNVIGPVALSGAVPNGALIEQGENANGQFVRYADGTQICWSTAFEVGAADKAVLDAFWTYPAAFATPPAVSFNLNLVNANWTGISRNQISSWGPIVAPTVLSAKLAVYPVAGSGTLTATIANTMPIAIGRWA